VVIVPLYVVSLEAQEIKKERIENAKPENIRGRVPKAGPMAPPIPTKYNPL
jgi:hypothetical protein